MEPHKNHQRGQKYHKEGRWSMQKPFSLKPCNRKWEKGSERQTPASSKQTDPTFGKTWRDIEALSDNSCHNNNITECTSSEWCGAFARAAHDCRTDGARPPHGACKGYALLPNRLDAISHKPKDTIHNGHTAVRQHYADRFTTCLELSQHYR
ncbi:Uncharacterised protein [Segatella buccae]|uniref:Uncharacterized protein n=1 Tax=Segatella buccae TaxID=28126 RepID=A0AAQ1UG65_9BACT|nr:Uncharacterised protein [Segatella buccae]